MQSNSRQLIEHIRSTDVSYRFTLDTPRDITGWSVTFSVKYRTGGAALLEKTVSGGGVTLTDTARGVITVSVAKANTSSLTPSAELEEGQGYVWDLKRTDSGSNAVLARGDFLLEREVTS